ncbi:putative transmembrane protein [Sesbania bispinosa]|nr:putative transmembrane protein [Sesbania bispinosa]
MATAASSSILQPEQQQEGAGETVPSSGAWQSSGSIGPFFAVISVLTVLAVLSCYFSRMWNRRAPTPLESIKGRGCFGWVKRRCRQFIARDVEVGGVGAKVMVFDHLEENDCKVKDGHDVPHQNLPQV